MTRKTKIITRSEASELRPKKLKPFSIKKFIKKATSLEKAIKREEERYGNSSRILA